MTQVTRIKTDLDLRRWRLGYRGKFSGTVYTDLPEFDATQNAAYAAWSALVSACPEYEWRLVEQIGTPQYS